ncbi:MFS transporter [Liquorilactobacillus capillatus]|uniref:Major facilitator transporter n=1 Tax=Liquorilactobacillus capillatus DSM 19910 TaxID=1423731 RepID=A0A0R1M305_9LACO|nr:MFS transporter [Liquorilactobacillus capillatus]KRL02413.1 major facilitator transporter [Liquorilactobacillus capillatus DSM 19910]
MEKTHQKKYYKHTPFSNVHLRIYLAIILGQFTSGYAIKVSGTAIAEAQKYLQISSSWIGLIGAGTLIGLAGSVFVGKISDNIGRRRLLLVNMYILTIISLCQLFTSNLWLTLIFRIIIGLMIAIDYTVGNTLLIEWLPFKESGKMQSHLIIYWVLGFIIAYFSGALITGFDSLTWKLIMASPAIPGVITAVFRSFAKLPASPSWLVNQGKPKKAQRIIQKHLGFKWGISKKQRKQVTKPSPVFSWTILFSKKYIRQTIVGGVFYASQSFTFFGISIFLPILVTKMGISNTDLVGYLYNGCMLVGVLLGIRIFRNISRRHFLVGDFILAAVCLLVLSLWSSIPKGMSLLIFSFFSIVLSIGLVIDYPYTSELFDSNVRGTGVGMVVTLSRVGAAAGTFLLPVITNGLGVKASMLLCGLVLLLSGIFCFAFAPETSLRHSEKLTSEQ